MNARIVIRQALASDRVEIVEFLRSHWRSDHVFVQDPELLSWQHADPDDPAALTFVLALREDEAGSDILGLLGYIPYRRFDPSLPGAALTPAIWRVRDDVGAPGLGLQLLNWIVKRRKPELIASIGVSDMVVPIYEAWGYTQGTLLQAALFAADGRPTKVATAVPEAAHRPVAEDPAILLDRLGDDGVCVDTATRAWVDAVGKLVQPRKSWEWIAERYVRHPGYDYELHRISVDGRPEALLVLREIRLEIDGEMQRVLRIVDMLGPSELLPRAAAELRRLIEARDCEYIDLVAFGFDGGILRSAGFVCHDDYDDFVIPNYFEPFERRRVRIKFAFKTRGGPADPPVRLMRGDSDQDRPSRPSQRNGGCQSVE